MENTSIQEQKSFLRKRAKAELKNYFEDKALALQCAKSASECFFKSKEYIDSKYIFAYMAMNDEIDMSIVIKKVLQDGKKVLLPRMTEDLKNMDFYFISSLNDDFTNDNKYKILEPTLNNKKIDINDIPEKSIFLVPGLAFNLEGARLGRGKGFYDKYLAKIVQKDVIFCGVCTVNVITKAIPIQENDFKMNYLLTEYGFISLHR